MILTAAHDHEKNTIGGIPALSVFDESYFTGWYDGII